MSTNKRGQVSFTEATSAIKKGVKKARSDYISMAGKVDRDWPEYWVTTYVAKEIWKKFGKTGFVTVESSAKNVLTRKSAGRPTSDTRGGIKYDIVLWKKNGDARAIIEIKHQQNSARLAMKDVARVVSALQKGKKLEFGVIGYYYDKIGKYTRDSVHNYREKVLIEAYALVEKTKCEIVDESYSMPRGDDDCWIVGCIIIKRKPWVRKK